MKWLLVLVLIVGAFFAYKKFSGPSTGPAHKPTTVTGTASAFIDAAISGNHGAVEALSDPAAKVHNLQTADELKTLIDPGQPLAWQKMTPSTGEDAVSADIKGKGKLLVIEVRKSGDEYKVCLAGLADK